MKKIKIFYWVVTGLLTAFAIYGSVLDLVHDKEAVALMKHIGYPIYFMSFIGVVRLLGLVGILVPEYPKIKEWAYAGLAYDMLGAVYSHIANGDGPDFFAPGLIGLLLVVGSYVLYSLKNRRIDVLL